MKKRKKEYYYLYLYIKKSTIDIQMYNKYHVLRITGIITINYVEIRPETIKEWPR